MRKYFADLLQGNSEYKRKMRNIKIKHEMLASCSVSLIKTLKFSEYEDSLPFYLAALAFPNDLRKILNKAEAQKPTNGKEFESCRDIIDTIEAALSRYSKKVLQKFMGMPEICKLLIHYLSKVRNAEYQDHFKMLKEMAEVSLEKTSYNDAFKSFRTESRIFKICFPDE